MKRLLVLLPVLAILTGLIYWYFFSVPSLPNPDYERTEHVRSALAEGTPVVIVALGDSITAGTNASVTYSSILEDALRDNFPHCNLDVHNAGVPGDTVAGGLRRLERDVISHSPDVVFVEFGWNDLRNAVKKLDFERDLRALAVAIQRNNPATVVFLMTTTHVNIALANSKIRARNKIIRRVAKETGCGLVDLYRCFHLARDSGASIGQLMSDDRIHPSEKGQRLIANAILRHLFPDREDLDLLELD